MSEDNVRAPAEDLISSGTLEKQGATTYETVGSQHNQVDTAITAESPRSDFGNAIPTQSSLPSTIHPTTTASNQTISAAEQSSGADRTEPTLAVGGEPSQSALEAPNNTAKNRGLLGVPSRSSSQANQHPSPTATVLTGVTASDPAGSIGRGSKGSISGKRRRGSATSSRRSKHEQQPAAVTMAAESTSSTKPQEGTKVEETKKKGGVSRFLAFLNCCSVPDNANTVETEGPAGPMKKVNKLQPKARPTTPVNKPEPVAAESSTAELKEPIDEKTAGIRDLEKPEPISKSEPMDIISPEGAASKSTDVDTSSEGPLLLGKEYYMEEKMRQDPSLRFSPESTDRVDTSANALEIPLQPSHVKVLVEAPTPNLPQEDGELAISDRTLQQVARDTEMTDAPPVDAVEEPTSEPTRPEAAPTRIELPPPPPLAERETQAGLGAPPRQATPGAPTPTEKQQWLLPPIQPHFRGKKCLVLDLDETLVHSSFKILHQADFTIPVEIEGQYHNVYVIKRPGVDQFMKRVGELYEVVVFTASVSKDLSQVGRDLRETIIIDNSPTSYIFHPQHAVPISSWFSDAHDNELLDLIPVLEDLAGSRVRDVSLVLDVAL
ncbi:MAG: hypothetical protein M1827_001292 [Pycnora praestabilis]|nr:MAG: hypothetical protein M1827_001292 [Pycnora praestabilis]